MAVKTVSEEEEMITASQIDSTIAHIDELEAEIARLQHDIERHIAICGSLATENEKLRAALELSGSSEVQLEAEVARLRAALEIVAATRAQGARQGGGMTANFGLPVISRERTLHLQAEVARLRAALEEILPIADGPARPLNGLHIATIVRKALTKEGE